MSKIEKPTMNVIKLILIHNLNLPVQSLTLAQPTNIRNNMKIMNTRIINININNLKGKEKRVRNIRIFMLKVRKVKLTPMMKFSLKINGQSNFILILKILLVVLRNLRNNPKRKHL